MHWGQRRHTKLKKTDWLWTSHTSVNPSRKWWKLELNEVQSDLNSWAPVSGLNASENSRFLFQQEEKSVFLFRLCVIVCSWSAVCWVVVQVCETFFPKNEMNYTAVFLFFYDKWATRGIMRGSGWRDLIVNEFLLFDLATLWSSETFVLCSEVVPMLRNANSSCRHAASGALNKVSRGQIWPQQNTQRHLLPFSVRFYLIWCLTVCDQYKKTLSCSYKIKEERLSSSTQTRTAGSTCFINEKSSFIMYEFYFFIVLTHQFCEYLDERSMAVYWES